MRGAELGEELEQRGTDAGVRAGQHDALAFVAVGVAHRLPFLRGRSRGSAQRLASGSNGPRPIWSRIVTTVGLVMLRRCQLAPSTTSVCPEMKRA